MLLIDCSFFIYPNPSLTRIFECDMVADLSSLPVCVYVSSHAPVNTAYCYVQWQAHDIVLLCDVYSTFPI